MILPVAWTLTVLLQAPTQQQPRLIDAKLETRAMRGSLAQEVAASREAPAWIAWTAPSVPGDRQSCWPSGNEVLPPVTQVKLEGHREFFVFLRVENQPVLRVRSFTPDCEIDAGGLPVTLLTGVQAQESVRYLRSIATDIQGAADAIGLHRGPEADAALEEMAAPANPDRIRRKAAFWLGATRASRGVELLSRFIRDERENEGFRQHVAFALSQSREGIAVLIGLAREARPANRKVREKAVFWLARSKDPEARRFIEGILDR